MKLEYQFTFKEYLEASRMSPKFDPFETLELWSLAVVLAGWGIVNIIAGQHPVWGYFILGFGICYIPIVKFLEWRNISSFDRFFFWYMLFFPTIKFVGLESEISVGPFLLIWAILQLLHWISQFLRLLLLSPWRQRTNIWHELIILKITESGLELETEKVSIKLKWLFYSHLLETKSLFVLYLEESSNIPHFFPKKPFNREQLQGFRELLYSNIPPVPHVVDMKARKFEFQLNFKDFIEATNGDTAHTSKSIKRKLNRKLVKVELLIGVYFLVIAIILKQIYLLMVGVVFVALLVLLSKILDIFLVKPGGIKIKMPMSVMQMNWGEPTTVEVIGDRLALKTPSWEANFKWEAFKVFIETRNLLLIYPVPSLYPVSKISHFILPKRAFSGEEELSDFKKLLHNNIGKSRYNYFKKMQAQLLNLKSKI
ncbi:YcxB family protein [Microcoleus sp. MOSTC5]|uniref:YcxB family protein n=1 Tax=Microcoleus sp. MOSTC5 TaxID=3055378 RepID=UPI002FD387A8